MQPWPRAAVRLVLLLFVIAAGYTAVRFKRAELVDFAVPRTAAARYLAHERLYRPEDGHYQYKYLPAFAPVMTPFAWMPREIAEIAWFALLVVMAWMFMRLSIVALPDRRQSTRLLTWLTLLLTGKFLVKELAFGQFNLPVALLTLGAVMAAQRGQGLAAGALIAIGTFVKPYALILLPWLAWTLGWRPLALCVAMIGAGLLLPAISYGWSGNLLLLHEWYRTVTETTVPNLLSPDNISFASMWAKWLAPGADASALAGLSAVAAVVAGLVAIARRRSVNEPNYLEGAYLLVAALPRGRRPLSVQIPAGLRTGHGPLRPR